MGQQFLLTSCWMCDLRFCPTWKLIPKTMTTEGWILNVLIVHCHHHHNQHCYHHHCELSDQRNGVATVRDGQLELFLLTLFIQLLALRWNFSEELLNLKYLSFDEDMYCDLPGCVIALNRSNPIRGRTDGIKDHAAKIYSLSLGQVHCPPLTTK